MAALLPELPGMARVAAGAGLQTEPGEGASRTLALDQRSVPGHTPSRMDAGGTPPASMRPPKRVSGPTRAPQAPALRLQSIATLDLEQLAAFTHDCRACKLGGLRHQAVFGIGHPRAHVMVIGEAPGAEEDRSGEPFVGAAGRLLDNMLRAVGLARNDADEAHAVFIANVIKCRPPGNRNPEMDEIAQCEPILARQIALVRPRLLLALGRFAAQTLTGSLDPIGRLRQRLYHYQGIPVVVSYHPAYLLRTPLDKAKAWADLCFAQEQLAVALATNSAAVS
ncbi:MAG: uracil-DNA glycosylase [Proteobacteria bacterium]|nr:uracil-DNA glycosylase [Pseudomonadota bacterium]